MSLTPSNRVRSSAVGRALTRFIGTEAAGGAVLVVAAIVGLVWSNSAWGGGYDRLWHTEIGVHVGDARLVLDLRHWINDALMALFFLVVGLEIKREIVEGDLGDRRTAALPIVAAVGGMVVPALLYLAVAGSGDASRGWGIPMATDIAFALGVMALVGRRLPSSMRLFLLTLAIVDDIGAIVVIAVFYSEAIDLQWLALAFAALAVVVALRRRGLVYPPLYVALGISTWLALHESGVHATLAGVAMGLLAPSRPALDRQILLTRVDDLADVFSPAAARETSRMARLAVSEMQWLEHLLHPWTSFVIVPLFALANAGVDLSGDVGDALTSRAGLGVMVGLVIGKPAGVLLFSWLAHRAGIASLPQDVTRPQFAGVAFLTGIGFTVSLFVTGLAFGDGALAEDARLGVLVSSVAASVVGAGVLLRAAR